MVITPKARAGSAPSPSDDNAQSKGKRKLTVDQIKVIGGYVKLDHSNLAKPNKIPKNNVSFTKLLKESAMYVIMYFVFTTIS